MFYACTVWIKNANGSSNIYQKIPRQLINLATITISGTVEQQENLICLSAFPGISASELFNYIIPHEIRYWACVKFTFSASVRTQWSGEF